MFHRKWKKVDQAEFLIGISHCLEKGYPLAEAIKMQSYEQPPKIKHLTSQMLQDLQSGDTISDVFIKARFPSDSCSFLYFSMQTGELPNGFYEGGRYLKLREKQKDKFNQLLRYPVFLMWIFVVMVYIVLAKLLPNFKQLYQAMSIRLPVGVQLMLEIPHHKGTLLILLLAVLGMLAILTIGYLWLFPVQRRLTHMTRIPYLSTFLKMYLSYYFAFHLGGLMKVGLPVNEALKLIEGQNFHPFFKVEALRIRKSLVNGLKLPDIVSHSSYYTRDLPIVMRNGEVKGNLGETLQDYSQRVASHLEDKITRAFSMIQPIFFCFFGGLIVGLFLSILTPMFAILKGM